MLDSLTPTRRLAVLGGAVGSLLLLVLIAVFSFTGGRRARDGLSTLYRYRHLSTGDCGVP